MVHYHHLRVFTTCNWLRMYYKLRQQCDWPAPSLHLAQSCPLRNGYRMPQVMHCGMSYNTLEKQSAPFRDQYIPEPPGVQLQMWPPTICCTLRTAFGKIQGRGSSGSIPYSESWVVSNTQQDKRERLFIPSISHPIANNDRYVHRIRPEKKVHVS